jgi:hypothetical protein
VIRRIVVTAVAMTAVAMTALVAPGRAAAAPEATAPPPVPTDVQAVADDRSAIVTWEGISPWGGSDTFHTITPYVGGVAQTPVQTYADGSARVNGLANGTAYRFTVTATTADGTSAPSARSAAVRPQLWTPFRSADRLIRRMHRIFADRAPTETELATWRDAFAAGTTTRTELVLALIDAPAWDDTVGALFRYYVATVNRPPDIEGLRYWLDELDSGRRTLSAIARQIGDSREALFLRGLGDDRSYVENLYTSVLSRRAAPAEVQYWLGRLAAGVPHWKVALLITEAAERGDPLSTRYYSLFIGFQDRVPDGNQSNSDLLKLIGGEITLADLVTASIGFTLR